MGAAATRAALIKPPEERKTPAQFHRLWQARLKRSSLSEETAIEPSDYLKFDKKLLDGIIDGFLSASVETRLVCLVLRQTVGAGERMQDRSIKRPGWLPIQHEEAAERLNVGNTAVAEAFSKLVKAGVLEGKREIRTQFYRVPADFDLSKMISAPRKPMTKAEEPAPAKEEEQTILRPGQPMRLSEVIRTPEQAAKPVGQMSIEFSCERPDLELTARAEVHADRIRVIVMSTAKADFTSGKAEVNGYGFVENATLNGKSSMVVGTQHNDRLEESRAFLKQFIGKPLHRAPTATEVREFTEARGAASIEQVKLAVDNATSRSFKTFKITSYQSLYGIARDCAEHAGDWPAEEAATDWETLFRKGRK